MRCGSMAILLEKSQDDYKVVSPLDKSCGWINEVQLSKTNPTTFINWRSKRAAQKIISFTK